MLINILAFIILCSVPGYFSFDYLDSSPTFPDDNSHEQIDHTLILAKHISNLYLSESYKDVDLDIDGEEVPAHRILLASRSENFGALLYGEDGKPYTNNVKISETPVALFMILLKYTYTGQVNLSDLEDTAVFKLGRISEYFGFFDLKHSLQEYSNEQIDHVHLLVSDISNLYLSKSYSDVVLVVGGEEFHAHRFLLASRSYYFGVLLFGGHRETYDKKVPINDVPVNLFKKLLKYIYTGLVVLSDLEGLDVLEFYRISDLFGFLDLTNSLNDYLQTTFEAENVCSFFVITRSFQYKKLIDASLDFIDNNAEDVLTADGFLSLPLEALQEIIIRDSFYTNEFEIFHAVCRWIHQKHDDLDHYSKVKVLSAVRYSLMSADEMSKAMKSKLVGSDIISEAIQKRKTSSPEHQFRGQRKPNVSLYFAPLKLTNGNLIPWVERLHGHNDDEDLDGGYNVIRFDNRTLINYIEIKLWNISTSDDQRYYSYDIEVSMDGYNWTRVINHSNYNCRSLQRLWIQPRIVQYIHVVGSKSDPNVTFKFCGVQYNTNEMHMVEINNGFVDQL
ncbi:BTB/POZ domain-containing protein 9-like [Adelges cooleyi]|uniref:BTB/POZ domain-containing protein 9-like n=1 Tax=Adelges cooleyi TaxID=133065 RepID=UPI00217FF64B|nr:BTB/POZ domain-containing protein 9-like [Adelges cooleyi]